MRTSYVGGVGIHGDMRYAVQTEGIIGPMAHTGLQGNTSDHWAKLNVGLTMMMSMGAMGRDGVNTVEGSPREPTVIPWSLKEYLTM